MAIVLECPRCQQVLSVPNRLAESYVACTHCHGSVWVPPASEAVRRTSQPAGDAAGATPTTPAPASAAAPPTNPAGPPSAPSVRRTKSTLPSPGPAAPGSPPAAPPTPAKKVARFLPAQATQPTLSLAEDGKLPELRLQEEGQSPDEEKSTSTNPLLLFGALCLSIVASLVLLLVDFDPQTSFQEARQATARRIIEAEYFSDLDRPGPSRPYQVLLREAQRAHARQDFTAEHDLYRQVLGLLRSEHGPFEGVTGSPSRDKKLEEQITVLLQ